MVSRTLRWSPEAQENFNEILAFYQERNGNSAYGDELSNRIEKALEYLIFNPYSGERARQRGFRFVIVKPFQLFYRVTKTEIIVAAV